MSNGQMKKAIEEAADRVSKYGYKSDDIDTKDVLLAGLGYVAEEVGKRSALVRVEGKKFFIAGIGISIVSTVFNVILRII